MTICKSAILNSLYLDMPNMVYFIVVTWHSITTSSEPKQGSKYGVGLFNQIMSLGVVF